MALALSNREEDTIYIPSDVLIASSDFFKASLSSRWSSQRKTATAVENAEHTPAIHSYGLTLDRQGGAYTLIRGVSSCIFKLAACGTNSHIEPARCRFDV